ITICREFQSYKLLHLMPKVCLKTSFTTKQRKGAKLKNNFAPSCWEEPSGRGGSHLHGNRDDRFVSGGAIVGHPIACIGITLELVHRSVGFGLSVSTYAAYTNEEPVSLRRVPGSKSSHRVCLREVSQQVRTRRHRRARMCRSESPRSRKALTCDAL